MPYYLNTYNEGIKSADSLFNGTDINVKWYQAYPNTITNLIAYNIYLSDEQIPPFNNQFFSQPPAFISLGAATNATITDLIPGQTYHFAIRAAEYNIAVFDLSTLPVASNGLFIIPSSLLSSNISATTTTIPLIDTSSFPSSGIIKLGTELIHYTSIVDDNLIADHRGYNGSTATIHNTDGYNGTLIWDPNAILWIYESEQQNTKIAECQNRFDIPNWSYLTTDGYRSKAVDLVNTNLTVSDDLNTDFPAYDYSGYHQTNPIDILNGNCVNSYIGGEQGCYDGYTGATPTRGLTVQDANTQRQEVLLNTTGEPVILVKRQWTGTVCSCMLFNQEYPEARCTKCLGTGFVVGWQQFFNDRRSDGRILVRFNPSIDEVTETEMTGLESVFKPDCWTLVVPTLHERDLLIRFDQDGNEEYRYEILNVTRNKFFLTYSGMQKFAVQRIRKTDVVYQIPILEQMNIDVDGQPGTNILRTLSTSINSSAGFPPHSHSIPGISQEIIDPSQVNTITSINYGHSHVIINGIVTDGSQIPGEIGLGHIHQLIYS